METPDELRFGGLLAEQLSCIKLHKPFTTETFKGGDEALLAQALLTGYKLIVLPRLEKDYTLVSVETEYPKLLAPWLTHNARPDSLWRRNSDQTLWYYEDKSTAWLDSLFTYTNNVQLHATGLCAEEALGERLAGCFAQGLYKGFKKEGLLYHSLVYAYRKEGIPGVMPDQWSAKWVRNWVRTPTTEFKGGIEGWINYLLIKDRQEVEKHFPTTSPVMLRRDLAIEHLAQVLHREEEIEAWRQRGRPKEEISKLFPKYFSQCDEFSKSRKPCVFKPMCWNPTTRRFPLQVYKYREPHHQNEKDQFDEQFNK